ncbi:hypothetical protein PR048_014452 [Dryococelus australis]|uniref:Uncharacterized protein n=1 Tax=Dryococelus australis TaxID=614101 RepID=A0ABQ9HEG7_9NEOP|nr:hypothetical protein PR048_014452 [Dryococelus australis]
MLAVVALSYEEEAEITQESLLEQRVHGREAREQYGRHKRARLVSHRSYAQVVQRIRRDAERRKDLTDHRDDSTFSFDPSKIRVKQLERNKRKKLDSRKGVLISSYSRKKTRRRKRGRAGGGGSVDNGLAGAGAGAAGRSRSATPSPRHSTTPRPQTLAVQPTPAIAPAPARPAAQQPANVLGVPLRGQLLSSRQPSSNNSENRESSLDDSGVVDDHEEGDVTSEEVTHIPNVVQVTATFLLPLSAPAGAFLAATHCTPGVILVCYPLAHSKCRLHKRSSKLDPRSDLMSTQKTVTPFEFRAGLEIEMKFISKRRSRRLEISIRDQQPFVENIDETGDPDITKFRWCNTFTIGTKIKLDPGSELGSFDLGSGRDVGANGHYKLFGRNYHIKQNCQNGAEGLYGSEQRGVESRRGLKRGENGAAPECNGGGKRGISEKARRQAEQSVTIPTGENPNRERIIQKREYVSFMCDVSSIVGTAIEQRVEPVTVTLGANEIRVIKCNGVSPGQGGNKQHMYTLPSDYLSHIVVLGESSLLPPPFIAIDKPLPVVLGESSLLPPPFIAIDKPLPVILGESSLLPPPFIAIDKPLPVVLGESSLLPPPFIAIDKPLPSRGSGLTILKLPCIPAGDMHHTFISIGHYKGAAESQEMLINERLHASLLLCTFGAGTYIFPAFEAKKPGNCKGCIGSGYKCAIAATREALNWYAVLSSHAKSRDGQTDRDGLTEMDEWVIRDLQTGTDGWLYGDGRMDRARWRERDKRIDGKGQMNGQIRTDSV